MPEPSPSTPPSPAAEAAADAAPASGPAVLDDPDSVLDAEIVETAEIAETDHTPTAPGPTTAADYDAHGVPGFDYVRDKIEQRYATAVGATELTADTDEARTIEDQFAERERAGQARLEEIRRSLRS